MPQPYERLKSYIGVVKRRLKKPDVLKHATAPAASAVRSGVKTASSIREDTKSMLAGKTPGMRYERAEFKSAVESSGHKGPVKASDADKWVKSRQNMYDARDDFLKDVGQKAAREQGEKAEPATSESMTEREQKALDRQVDESTKRAKFHARMTRAYGRK